MMACGAAPIWLHDAVRVGHFAAKDVNIWNESKLSKDAENSVLNFLQVAIGNCM